MRFYVKGIFVEENNDFKKRFMEWLSIKLFTLCYQELEAQNMFNTEALGEGEETFNNPVALKLQVKIIYQ